VGQCLCDFEVNNLDPHCYAWGKRAIFTSTSYSCRRMLIWQSASSDDLAILQACGSTASVMHHFTQLI